MNRLTCSLFAALQFSFCLLASTGPADAQPKRIALVVGNEDYPSQPGRLNNPREDAERIAIALEAVGFTVTRRFDRSQSEVVDDVGVFSEALTKAGPETIGFFYYSGHGASAEINGKRRNYIMPAKTVITSGQQLALRGVPLDQLIDGLAATNAKAIFFVSDACRNTLPWSDEKGGDLSKSFNAVERRSGLYVAFAAADGQTAPDDGYFSAQLARVIRQPGQTADRAFTLALREVAKRRAGERLPFVADGLASDVCFISCPNADADAEADFWQFSRSIGTPEVIRSFLARYPASRFRPEAEKMLSSMVAVSDPRANASVILKSISGDKKLETDWDVLTAFRKVKPTADYLAYKTSSQPEELWLYAICVLSHHAECSAESAREAVERLETLSAAGYVRATLRLAIVNAQGLYGRKPDIPRSEELIRKATRDAIDGDDRFSVEWVRSASEVRGRAASLAIWQEQMLRLLGWCEDGWQTSCALYGYMSAYVSPDFLGVGDKTDREKGAKILLTAFRTGSPTAAALVAQSINQPTGNKNADAAMRGVTGDELVARIAEAASRGEMLTNVLSAAIVDPPPSSEKLTHNVKVLERYASDGHGYAQMLLANMYGERVPEPRPGEIRRLNREACERGNLIACFNLSLDMRDGRNGPADMSHWKEYVEKAANAGLDGAQGALGIGYATGSWGYAQDVKRGADLVVKGARAGWPWSLYYLGFIQEKGLGVVKDSEEAIRNYRAALAKSPSDAELAKACKEGLARLGFK